MKKLTIPLSQLILDPEREPGPASPGEQAIRDAYRFLPAKVEVIIADDAVTVQSDEDSDLSGPARKQYDRAVSAAEQARYKKAIELFEKVLQAAPLNTEARRDLAMAYLEFGEIYQARQRLVETLRLDPNDAWANLLMGNFYAKDRAKAAVARGYYDRAHRLKPDDVYLMINYGALLANEGDYQAARDLFQKAIAIDPAYPNAYVGLAMTYLTEDDSGTALSILDELFDQPVSHDIRSGPVYEKARRLYLDASQTTSESSFDSLMEFVDDRRAALEKRIGTAIEIVEDNSLDGISASAQFAWKYGRDRHVIRYRVRRPAVTPYLLAHEMEHIALSHIAREVGCYRDFTTTPATLEPFIGSIAGDLYKLQDMGYSEDKIVQLRDRLVHGLANQLFNIPVDLIIDYRLFRNCPELRHSEFASLHLLYHEEPLPALTNPGIKAATPKRIYQASLAMTCAAALFADHLYKGRTAYADPYRQSNVYPKGEKLFALWQETVKHFEPGDEYRLVDQFADVLGLQELYEWKTDQLPASPEEESSVTNPDLLQAKEASAMWYCLDALQRFEKMPPEDVRAIAFEIALLGQSGLDYASPDQKYTLNSLPGKRFSGLHLLCLMYAGFKQIDPSVDLGLDLAEPYRQALALHQSGGDSQ